MLGMRRKHATRHVLSQACFAFSPSCCPQLPRFFVSQPGRAFFPSGSVASRPGHGIPLAPRQCSVGWSLTGKVPTTRSWSRLTGWTCPWRTPVNCSGKLQRTGLHRACFAVRIGAQGMARILIASFYMDIYVHGRCRPAPAGAQVTRRILTDRSNNRSLFEYARYPRGYAPAS